MFAKASNDRPVEIELISYFKEDRKNQENVLDTIFYLKKLIFRLSIIIFLFGMLRIFMKVFLWMMQLNITTKFYS